MEKIWVVAADGVRARFFTATPRVGELTEVTDHSNPKARLPGVELATDTVGRSFVGGAQGRRQTYGDENAAKEQVRDDFARTIAREIGLLRSRGELLKFYLVAEPGFLGAIRSHLDAQSAACLAAAVGSGVATRPPKEIRAALPDFL